MSRVVSITAAIVVAWAAAVAADEWNDKTILKFSQPVMVPGATLQPGSYIFKLMDLSATRHTVQIMTEDGSKQIAIASAVPIKRTDPKGDVVLKFNPTDAGSPPALKGWFYPGSLYGHEFVYPEEQARQIAERTKTLVLSIDVPGSDLEKGKIRTYDASGARTDWRGDSVTMKEWDDWQTKRRASASANVASPEARTEQQKEATAPMVKGDFQGLRVRLDELEDNPQKYLGQTISVDAEVEDVFGPRVFTIDEPNWADLEGETLVFMPTTLAALVKENDRVTVTGTMKPFVRAEVEREWGWAGLDKEIEVDLAKKPVLVASRIVGGNNNTAIVIDLNAAAEDKPVGTSGDVAAGKTAITDVATIARGSEDLVGHQVNLTGLKVENVAKDGGFFAKMQNSTVFVLPASKEKGTAAVKAGDTVSVKGVVFELSQKMENRLGAAAEASGFNDSIYIYARSVNDK